MNPPPNNPATDASEPFDVALVMPVYNEEECIARVVESWRAQLSGLGLRYRMIVLNDGSRDGTARALDPFRGLPDVEIVDKPNTGHGPSILLGYRKAVELAPWVFQCDSDDEMRPEGFAMLWERRADFDALFGWREGRRQNVARAFISWASRQTVTWLFGREVHDVNTPFRLMRADCLREVVGQIPDDTFAPNVAISGAFARSGLRIYNTPTPHAQRMTGKVSIVKWALWRAAALSFGQTLALRRRMDLSGLRRIAAGRRR